MPATKRVDQIKSLIKSELIRLLKEDDSGRQSLAEITAGKYAEKAKTENRFDGILDELKADRQRQEEFYEQRHNRKADHFIVISPMVDPLAQKVAQELGLEVYSFAEDVSFETREPHQIR